MNILFFCSRNQWRSRTAEDLFKNNGLHLVKSAGTSAAARRKVNENLLVWADCIIVMERKHKKLLNEKFRTLLSDRKLYVLNIPDKYKYMDTLLVELLNERWKSFLNVQ